MAKSKSAKPQKIAVLGAGPSALTAAIQLTNDEDWKKKYDITIYQQGWRVGGKCATGRDMDHSKRLYEHGIHGFLGCYFNALTVMKDIFEALERPDTHPLPTFESNFYGMSGVIRYEMEDGLPKKWPIYAKPNERHRKQLTYDQVKALARTDVYAVNMIGLGLRFLSKAYAKTFRNIVTQKFVEDNFVTPEDALKTKFKHPMRTDPPAKFDMRIEDGKEDLNKILRKAMMTVLGDAGALFKMIEAFKTMPSVKVIKAMETARDEFKELSVLFFGIVEAKGGSSESERDRIRRAALALDFVSAILRGVLKDDLLFKNFTEIDHWDHDEWLRDRGEADPRTINSPLTSSTPNITYQYPQGDSIRQPVMAAGAYLHWTMMTFTFMGEFIQVFTAGSGETLIGPMYELLEKRGVKFAFFHTVTDIRSDAKGQMVEEVAIDVQATMKNGDEFGYNPFVKVKGLNCWPDRPLYKQLKQGDALEDSGADLESFWCDWAPVGSKTLKRGEDFDQVLIGISVGGVKFLTKSMQKANPRWKAMCDNATTVVTQAMQIWLKETPWDLGWNGYTNEYDDYLLSANFMTQPNGQGDFTKYIEWEDWPKSHTPASLLLLCGTLPFYHEITGKEGADFPRRLTEQVKHQSIQFLQATGGFMLPGATVAAKQKYGDPFSFDFDLLHPTSPKTEGRKGAQRFDDQYWRVNVNPSDHYVSSPPKKTQHRLYANDTGFKNLSIAGDWTSNGLNVGSMEGSVRSGILAAEAIMGVPHSKSRVLGFRPEIKKPASMAAGSSKGASKSSKPSVRRAGKVGGAAPGKTSRPRRKKP
ncbi:MAG: FAD-dependent oxidoreductase [Pseudomonadota bacterium]